jgi:hypothetical protein
VPGQKPQPTPKPTPDPKLLAARSQSLAEASLAELPQLQRLDNRIIAQSWLADLLWPQDAARARALMNEAIAQCVTLMQQTDAARADDYRVVQPLTSALHQVLQILTKHDGRLALDFLRQMREVMPPALQNILGQRRDWEMDMAAQLAAAEPQLALQIVKESLEHGLHHNLAGLWQTMQSQDPAAAAELFDVCWRKIKAVDDSPEQQRLNIAINFTQTLRASLQNDNQKKSEEEQQRYDLALRQFREAAEWLIAEALKLKPTDFLDEQRGYEKRALLQQLKNLLPDIAKHLPYRAAALRAKLQEHEAAAPAYARYENWQKKMENKRPEEIIALAQAATREEREFLVTNALQRAIGENANEAQTRKLIQDNVKDPNQRQQLLRQVARQASQKAFAADNLAEARARLNDISHSQERAQVLWEWATQKHAAGDGKTALALLEEIGALIGEGFDSMEQTDWQLNRATLYAELEPARAAQLCSAAVDRLNVVLQARAVVRAYEQGLLNGAENEMPLAEVQGQLPYHLNSALLKLTEKNFAEVQSVIARWQGLELRLQARLRLARELQRAAGIETQSRTTVRVGQGRRQVIH